MKKVILATMMALIAVPAFAQTGASSSAWALYLGAGLAIGLAGLVVFYISFII